MIPKQVIEKGKKYNFLELTGNYEYRGKVIYVEVKCVCGKIKLVRYASLKINETKSCGCQRKGLISKLFNKHGMSNSIDRKNHPIYTAYHNMIDRCTKETATGFKDYGGRGITVCKSWTNSFTNFKKWALSNGWQQGLTLDRKDTDGNYTPYNCRWVTKKRQQNNRRCNINITAFGETKTLVEWSEDSRCMVRYDGLKVRVKKMGWDSERAITTPAGNQGTRKSPRG